jgi:aspartyl-tRNA(Asn)/glutamyl-tRNA(Gln) amidotransferase subunit C
MTPKKPVIRHFDKKLVEHIANLANIPISSNEADKLATEFDETVAVIDNLQSLDVTNVEPTHQVTGLENVWREDIVQEKLSFSQEEALDNSNKTHQGYFVVERIIDEK